MPKKTNPFQQVIASLLDLLENSSVVTESIEYPDPHAGNPREVDITLVRGEINGQQVKIGVECTDLGRKATQTWVDTRHGKHSRLQQAGILNALVLVSDSGFTGPARTLAENLGHLAIHPNIAESELAAAISERMGPISVMAASTRIVNWNVNYALPPNAEGFKPVDSPEEPWLFRADGARLVLWSEVEEEVQKREGVKRYANPVTLRNQSPRNEQYTIDVDQPDHQGERLYARFTNGSAEFFALIEKFTVTLSINSTNTADMRFTHTGNFGGHGFATGQSPIGDTTAVIVGANVGGEDKLQVRFNFDADKGHPPRKAPKKVAKAKKKR